MYACPTCGAGLIFDPKTQKLQCLSCRNNYDPENVEKMRLDQAHEIKEANEDLSGDNYDIISYKCSHCGAELLTSDETISTFCSFCRTGTMLDRKIIEKRKPDYIIPFKITKEECKDIYVKKIRNAFFAPKSMIDTQEVQKIRGIYMPYWIYSFEKHGEYSTKGKKYSHRSGDYVYYDDYLLTTTIDSECSGITHDATSNFSDRLSESIAPFSISEKKNFSPSYLSGYYADNEDVDKKVYTSESDTMASDFISKKLKKDLTYFKYKAKPQVPLNEKTTELGLFPVYYLAIKNKKGDRISYAVINGQTGRIAADIPIDIKKFGLFSVLLSIPIFILLNLFITLSIPKLIICSILFNLISILILHNQSKEIHIRENELVDKGMQSKAQKKEQTQYNVEKKSFNTILTLSAIVFTLFIITLPFLIVFIEKYPYLLKLLGYGSIIVTAIYGLIRIINKPDKDISIYKPVLGLMLTIVLFLVKPVSDMYYYGVALISIAISIVSFYDIICKYNILTSRKLPQLGKRGGDENA